MKKIIVLLCLVLFSLTSFGNNPMALHKHELHAAMNAASSEIENIVPYFGPDGQLLFILIVYTDGTIDVFYLQ